MLLALACLLICVIAGWYVVSRRGFVRAVAAVVMVAALGGLATGLVFANLNLLALVLVIAVSAMSVVSARYALRARPAGSAGSAADRGPPERGGPAPASRSGNESEVRGWQGRALPARRGVLDGGASSPSCCGQATTCSGWPTTRSAGAPT